MNLNTHLTGQLGAYSKFILNPVGSWGSPGVALPAGRPGDRIWIGLQRGGRAARWRGQGKRERERETAGGRCGEGSGGPKTCFRCWIFEHVRLHLAGWRFSWKPQRHVFRIRQALAPAITWATRAGPPTATSPQRHEIQPHPDRAQTEPPPQNAIRTGRADCGTGYYMGSK